MYGDFPAKNTVYTPYVPINVWFWPTLCRSFLRCVYVTDHSIDLAESLILAELNASNKCVPYPFALIIERAYAQFECTHVCRVYL